MNSLNSAQSAIDEANRLIVKRHPLRKLIDLFSPNRKKVIENLTTAIGEFIKEQKESNQAAHAAQKELIQTISDLEETTNYLSKAVASSSDSIGFARRPSEETNITASPARIASNITPVEFDKFYQNFEDLFRGTRESVSEKQHQHLSTIQKTLSLLETRPEIELIDLACGRGEWLEILKENKINARGIDLNTGFIKQCEDLNLDVTNQDIFEFLSTLPDKSCGAITAFHIVEHLSFNQLWLLYKETLRVLVKGGVAIFETPNPFNIRTAAHFFLTDITHVRPFPPSLAAFLAQYHDAAEVEIQQYHPFPESDKYADLPPEVNVAIYGPQDYAVVFTK